MANSTFNFGNELKNLSLDKIKEIVTSKVFAKWVSTPH